MSENKVIREIEKVSYISCNRNLLDNWYFVTPVNQRKITSSWNWEQHAIGLDRWHRQGDGMSYWRNGRIEQENSELYQVLDLQVDEIAGLTITISALTSDGELLTFTGVVPKMNGQTNVWGATNWCTIQNSSKNQYVFSFSCTNVIAVKFEINDHQTLAHQLPSGKWELNELPNYGEEIMKCQRFYRTLPTAICNNGAVWVWAQIDFDPPMRATPTIYGGVPKTSASTTISNLTWESTSVSSKGLYMFKFPNSNTNIVHHIDNLIFSAEL